MNYRNGLFAGPDGNAHTIEEVRRLLPPPEYPKGPIDFAFAKDPVRREKVANDVQWAFNVLCPFVKDVLLSQFRDSDLRDATRRLNLPPMLGEQEKSEEVMSPIYMDYALSLNDARNGETILEQTLAKMDDMEERHRLGARYFKNYRYTWLYVEAVRGSFGCKCRNLMTGEELFLSLRRLFGTTVEKGKTICVGIAPIGSVYILLGEAGGGFFESPEEELRKIREELGLPTEGPLVLSTADQARFAMTTIRELYCRFGLAAFG